MERPGLAAPALAAVVRSEPVEGGDERVGRRAEAGHVVVRGPRFGAGIQSTNNCRVHLTSWGAISRRPATCPAGAGRPPAESAACLWGCQNSDVYFDLGI
jgi:hypothetical protein